jgi:hypothetical protein
MTIATQPPELPDENQHQDLLLELKTKIAERKELRDNLIKKLEQMLVNIERLRIGTKTVAAQRSQALIARRTELEREMGTCQREILHEELACWRDVAQLEAELREVQQQISLTRENEN